MQKKHVSKNGSKPSFFRLEFSVYALQFSAVIASGILLKDSVYFAPVLIIEILSLFGMIAVFYQGKR